jgi:hypothetical protein
MSLTAIKIDLKQRLLTFEAFNGAFIFLPWGAGFIYCGLFDQRMGYSYTLLSAGIVLIIWGLRKLTVNRVKQKAKLAQAVQAELSK